ncbi:LacI family DNA-binding transcriptional regulator [Nocardioides sp. zg-1228]|uniref:LacI family DNA-binding transcriptional regulator n=1 Tax=Nocardioides sp. zg-1228 TaxID=2763008 RepID=UPI00164238AA|nr:LacI family DNA-binding transcriptional regulator [Nocardioides sp. zg-1228]MBC2932867.1 LacI family DNA-binding transcriptional regulator [Nocardioides sp. zg-1228]QSF56922.1 LacI family DNA-binding transcriptional regulator [Nocardioides sp. zg-1228]
MTGQRTARRVTMQQVAAEAGVSVSTVSKVINGRYGISAVTAAHVSGVIERLGYETSLVARSLRNQRTHVVGVLVADFEPFSTEVLKGAADAIRGSGFELVAYSAGGRVDEHVGWERRYLSRLMGTLVDGAVLVTPTVTDVDADGPVVAIDPHTGSTTIPTVTAHNLQGASAGVRHLLELGHTRIGMVTGRADLVSAQLREQGFRDALGEAGVPVDESLVVRGAFETDVAREVAHQLLGRSDRPTAVFAANDQMALAVLDVARELGIDVPGDLSLVGFDNIPESALSEPPLTTVAQPIREMGRDAVSMLLGLIEGREPADVHHTLGTELVLRRSTRALGGVAP